jgi:hypothetical protein
MTKVELPNNLAAMSDDDLIFLRARLQVEMRKRKIASVGDVGEMRAIDYFRKTPKLPKLMASAPGTKNVDANSRSGERYTIKTICDAKKTGTIYPDPKDKSKQLFEYLLIVRLDENWSLNAIYQISWQQFVVLRLWDKRMNAWYVGCSEKTLSQATLIYKVSGGTLKVQA